MTKVKIKSLYEFLIFLISFIILICIDQSKLPDYEAYKLIYENSLINGSWEIAFVFINSIFFESGISYDSFRNSIFIFSIISLFTLFSHLKSNSQNKSLSEFIYNVFLLFIVTVFLFEYSVIRIRAGLAIGYIFFAIIFLNMRRNPLNIILSTLLFIIAFYTHRSTTAILTVFLGIPALGTIINPTSHSKKITFLTVSAISVVYLLYITNDSFDLRGEHLTSPLNPVRFFMLSIIPLFMFLFIKNEKDYDKLDGNLSSFSSYFFRFYIVLAVGLCFMFFAGLTNASGEALVRLYTLSSVPALISIRYSGSIMRAPFSAYILAVNAAFFLVTVLLPSEKS